MNIKVNKEENNTYKIDVTVPLKLVDKHIEKALKHEAEHVEVKGFRKGKAPLSEVKKNIDAAKLRSHALNHLLSDIYQRIINENKLKPIVSPRFEIKQFEEGQDLILIVYIIEKPEITIDGYKEAIKKLYESKKDTQLTNEQVIDELVKTAKIGISKILVDEEVNRMMSSLIDQTSKLGLTVDQYLEAHKKTPGQLRQEYALNAEKTLKADFILTEIAQQENMTVSDEEIAKTISAVPDAKSREVLEKPEQKMYIKAVLLKGKVLESLKGDKK